MKEFLPIIKTCSIFKSLEDKEILSSLSCLGAKIKSYNKGGLVFSEGDSPRFIGVILSGEAEIRKQDYSGNSNIIKRLECGGVVAAAACYSSEKLIPFDIYFAQSGKLLCLDTPGLISPCSRNCANHLVIIKNLLGTIADSNIALTEKIDVLTKRSIREKLLALLYSHSKKTTSNKFFVPLSRQQMADYLSVDRSALSRELGQMKDDGVIDFDNKTFWFL